MNTIYVIDASGYIYRSYFAIRQMTNSKGESTNALFGFIRSLLKLMNDFHPSHLVAVFDGPNNTSKRTEIYADYKAHRKEMPGDLLYQIHWAQTYCEHMGIPSLTIPGVEADDTMGSLAQWASHLNASTFLCTSDKDMCQLINEQVFVLNTYKDNLIIDSQGVVQQFGVLPNQMIDFLSITGDSSDNIPGIPGLGPKTAAELLKTFGSLRYLLEHPTEIPGKRKQELFIQHHDQALLSQRLVTIDTQVPIPTDPLYYQLRSPDYGPLREFYAQHNFTSLIREMGGPTTPLPAPVKEAEDVNYQLVDDENALKELIDYLKTQKEICLDTETTSLSPLNAELVGIGLGVEPKKAWYIPVNGQLGLDKVLRALKPIFEDPSIGFYGHHLKYDYHILANYAIQLAHISFDTILASYVLSSHSRQHSLDHLSLEIFDKIKIPIESLIGKGKSQINMQQVPIDKVCEYCCEDIDYTIRLKQILSSQLEQRKLTHILYDIELPLLPILAQMERHGIYVDTAHLRHLSKEIAKEIANCVEAIYAMAGETFNLNSPKQLSEILFNKLGIKPPKKTATGHSTNADVLESLQNEYPIAKKILEYRTLEKLRSTYIETLPKQINAMTHRIHCNFNQSMAATGRLSCQDPNLQNIPVRTPIGREIREAFRPQQKDWIYLAADYSQIELRLLAHLSEDPMLLEAFNSNEDVHTFTASQIFGVALEEVTPEQRYQAKAVNFGTIYGQQAFGLAQLLGIDSKTAATFIHMYFDRYKNVKKFLNHSKELARQSGKAVTLQGRERLIPEINSKNALIRTAAERLAINMPIQGTQADLIKIAMISIDKKLKEAKMESYMILQIHDELLFEVAPDELNQMQKLVKESMEAVMSIKVPLIVDIHIGKNWKEC